MTRRSFFPVVVLLGSASLTIAGCESLREAMRTSNDDKIAKAVKPTSGTEEISDEATDATKILAPDATAKNPRAFFQNNRRSGGWSSEAREIESHLGVGP